MQDDAVTQASKRARVSEAAGQPPHPVHDTQLVPRMIAISDVVVAAAATAAAGHAVAEAAKARARRHAAGSAAIRR